VSISIFGTQLSPIPSVGLPVCRIVAKQLIGSGCRLGWWVGSVERWCIRWEWWSLKGKCSFGCKCGASGYNQSGLCCIVVQKCVNRSSCHLGRWVGSPQAFMY